MIFPNEEVYQGSGGNKPTCATRPTKIPNIRKGNTNIQGPPHSRTLKLRSKIPPPLMGPPHTTSTTNIEPPAPGPHEPPPIRRVVP